MIINSPGTITSRLCAGVKIGPVTISIEYSPHEGDNGRTRYRYFLDMEGQGETEEYHADDLQSGCQGGNLQEGLINLFGFLSAAGEAYGYELHTGRESDNSSLFSEWVSEWAYQYSDELSLLAYDIEEGDLVLIAES